jgi:chromosome partitioning protein
MARTSNQRIEALVTRQSDIARGRATQLPIPRYQSYTICNLRGGIGKTSLAFNLSYLAEDLLAVDTCPQGNLSFFYDQAYYQNATTSVNDMLLPYFLPGLGKASRVAQRIDATNQFFTGKNSFFVPSAADLYMLPSQMANALVQARTVSGAQQQSMIDNMLFSLKQEIEREQVETKTTRCLIDTSPFFSGCTHLAWHASDALIVPVRTDQQSINSLLLLLNTLSNSASEFRRTMPQNGHAPKIQLIVLTHCGWSTKLGAQNEPNKSTIVFLEQVRDVVSRNITHFTTDNPDNHIVLLDDFLGSGRISSALSKPIQLMNAGDTVTINRAKTEVNASVDKIKSQLKFINDSIW